MIKLTPKELEYAFMMLGEKEPKVIEVESVTLLEVTDNNRISIRVGIVDENYIAYNWNYNEDIKYWL